MGALTFITFAQAAIVGLFVSRLRRTKPLPGRGRNLDEMGEYDPQVAYEMQPLHYSQLGEPYHPRRRVPIEYQRNGENAGFAIWTEKE